MEKLLLQMFPHAAAFIIDVIICLDLLIKRVNSSLWPAGKGKTKYWTRQMLLGGTWWFGFFCWNMAGWLFCKWCVKCIRKHCDHWHQQMWAESKTRGKVMLDSFHQCFILDRMFSQYLRSHLVCLFGTDILGTYAPLRKTPHTSRLSFLSLALTPSPSPYLCVYASLLLIFLPWEPRKPSSHLSTPPLANAQKDSSLHACTL